MQSVSLACDATLRAFKLPLGGCWRLKHDTNVNKKKRAVARFFGGAYFTKLTGFARVARRGNQCHRDNRRPSMSHCGSVGRLWIALQRLYCLAL